MRADHLSDMELQQWVLDPSNTGADHRAHLGQCEECMIRAGEYRLLIAQIKQESAPVFDFDLAGTVLSQLPDYDNLVEPGYERAPLADAARYHRPVGFRRGTLSWPILLVISIVPGGLLYLFGKEVWGIFSGFSGMMLWMLVTSAALILLFQGMEVYRKYQRKIDALNLY
ncbi:MAG TPA: hypothetical protein VL832_22300 [Puia sp.]|nr:hypothetical protein [Puia sp.]